MKFCLAPAFELEVRWPIFCDAWPASCSIVTELHVGPTRHQGSHGPELVPSVRFRRILKVAEDYRKTLFKCRHFLIVEFSGASVSQLIVVFGM